MNENTRELATDSRFYYFIHPPRHSRPSPATEPPPTHSYDGLPWGDFWNNDILVNLVDSSSTAAESLLTSPESSLSSSEQTQLLLYDILIPLLGSLIIVLNLAVVISSMLLLRKGQQPYTTYLFLGNVAAADLLTGFAVIYGQYAPREIRGEDNCAILIGLIVSTTLVSVYSVGLIAVDRYLYIMYGLQYQRYITPARARLLIIGTWLLGLVIGFLPAFGWRGDTEGGRICWFIRLAPPPLVILTTVLGIIPVLVVIVLYSIILHKAIRRVAQLKKASREQQGASLAGNLRLFRGGGAGREGGESGGQSTDTEQPLAVEDSTERSSAGEKTCCGCCGRRPKTSSQPRRDTTTAGKNPTRRKAIKVVMLTTGCFVVTWLPYFIASTMFVLCDPATNEDLCRGLQFAIASPLAILGFTNSLLNPVIYAWWHQGFRNGAKRLWARACPCCHRRRSSYKSSSQDSGGPVPAPRTTTTTTSSSSGETSSADLPRGSNVTTSTGVVSLRVEDQPTSSTSFRRNNSNNINSTFKPTPRHRSAASSDLENRITIGAPAPVPSIRQMSSSSAASSSTTTRL